MGCDAQVPEIDSEDSIRQIEVNAVRGGIIQQDFINDTARERFSDESILWNF